MAKRVLGVIGGSGISSLPGLENVEEVEVATPFGTPSGPLLFGTLERNTPWETRLVFLPRHGPGHQFLPHEINYRANIFAMKLQGVQWLVSISAVGSMREGVRPGDVVIVDQFIDRTSGRQNTFFGNGLVAHVAFGDPVSPVLRSCLKEAATEAADACERDVRVHPDGTYLVMNGPQFSTRAESNLYRLWGVDVIGMTNMPEAKLAREAEMSFATLALSTDYDCWHDEADDVTVEGLIAVLRQNTDLARNIVAKLPKYLPSTHDCIARNALQNAIMTDLSVVPKDTLERLAPLIDKYTK